MSDKRSEGSIGAKEATAGLSDAVYKRFNGVERGEAAYEECQMTGVLAALKNKMDNERFIVIKGSDLNCCKPGVKMAWGEIIHLIGTINEAEALFEFLKAEGIVEPLPSEFWWGIA
ncbi:hypothetical protein BDP27DRAFT_1370389 [Rhodocollybia butyracea]|uniref:Uncharacterized protein n=1 Tax=Rhodocollybia butyracea TaxID=206335 RepID=A0A9P5PC47_9AGAR|nr:hypothetical protein BDP27DRAFT_1370389 [Rhodocollybia butyracea]